MNVYAIGFRRVFERIECARSVPSKSFLYAEMQTRRNSTSSFGSVMLLDKWKSGLVSSSHEKGALGWTNDVGISSWQALGSKIRF